MNQCDEKQSIDEIKHASAETTPHSSQSIDRGIWVLGDTRNQALLDSSLNVLAGARDLAAMRSRETSSGEIKNPSAKMETSTLFVFMTCAGEDLGEGEGALPREYVMEQAIAHGADQVLVLNLEAGSGQSCPGSPIQPGTAARMLAHVVPGRKPDLLLFPLNNMMREMAARCAFLCRGGMIADCLNFRYENGEVVAVCPSHGGEIMAELGFSHASETGFITVQPNAFKREKVVSGPLDPCGDIAQNSGEKSSQNRDNGSSVASKELIETLGVVLLEQENPDSRIRLISRKREKPSAQSLESADRVVAGGAGLGNIEGFRSLRKLAAALGARIGATRPPVLWHWTDEESLIGQTGKSIKPELLITVGTSGAVQYTAGITEAKTIVAVNRDPQAPIFQFADIGIVEDAATFLPLFTDKVQKIAMRALADSREEAQADHGTHGADFGSRLMQMRTAHQLTHDDLARKTGRTPEFIEALENNQTTPSVGFMIRLSEVMGIDPGTFLNEEERSTLSDTRAKEYTRRTANYYYRTLTPGAEDEHLRVFMVTIESSKKHKPVAYRHEGEEFIYVMEGALELTLDGKARKLMTGESVKFNSQTPHELKSMGGEDTRCLVTLYTP